MAGVRYNWAKKFYKRAKKRQKKAKKGLKIGEKAHNGTNFALNIDFL